MARCQSSLPCVAVCLLAALMLHSVAAESKCDPSSTNCAGPLREAGVVQTAAAGGKLKARLSYQDRYEPEGYDYANKKWQQEGGLEGAPVHGSLQFNTRSPLDYGQGANYFDPEEGYVPEGYGNSHKSPTCEITNYGTEFAYEGNSNLFTVDIDCDGKITLDDLVKVAGKNNEMIIVLKSPAFVGYTLSLVSSTFGAGGNAAVAKLSGDTITITVAAIPDLSKKVQLQAVWKLSVCTEDESNKCCKNGQYRHKGFVCREAAGLCDEEECCTGESAECPNDEYKHKGFVCRHPKTFCDKADECNGEEIDCPDLYKPANTACPWARDCLGCDTNSLLSYTRTGPKSYSKGSYKAGDYGVPKAKWPVCVGKCAVDECVLDPTAAFCCREDEDAYDFEEEHGYHGYEEYHAEEEETPEQKQAGAVAPPADKKTSGSKAAPQQPSSQKKESASRRPRLDTPVGIAGISIGNKSKYAKHYAVSTKGLHKHASKKHYSNKDHSDEEYSTYEPKHIAHKGKDYYDADSKEWFAPGDGPPAPKAKYEDKYGKYDDKYGKYDDKHDDKYDDKYGKHDDKYEKEGYGKEGYGKEGYGYGEEESDMPTSCWS